MIWLLPLEIYHLVGETIQYRYPRYSEGRDGTEGAPEWAPKSDEGKRGRRPGAVS